MSQTTRSLLNAQTRTAQLTESDRHRLLEHDRRRHALAVLTDRTEPLDLAEMATAVAQREADTDEADPEAVSTVTTTLHHIHLPKMADAGVVEYEPASNRIVP